MKYAQILGMAMALVVAAGMVTGCGSKPPEDVEKATVSEAKEVERRSRTAEPAPEVEEAPVEEATEAVGEAAEESMEVAESAVEEATESAETVAEEAVEAAEAVAEETMEAAETATESAAEAVEEAAEAVETAVAGDTVYTIEPNNDSEITWVGYGGVMGSMEGGFANFSGTVALAGDNVETAEIDVEVDMTSIYSGARALTKKLLGDEFFHTEEYPKAVFQSTGVVKTEAGYDVTGNVKIMDQELSITFPAQITVDEKGVRAESEFTIDRRAWGINYEGTGDNFIKDEVLVRFKLLATP